MSSSLPTHLTFRVSLELAMGWQPGSLEELSCLCAAHPAGVTTSPSHLLSSLQPCLVGITPDCESMRQASLSATASIASSQRANNLQQEEWELVKKTPVYWKMDRDQSKQ